jgi:hypothetical protein
MYDQSGLTQKERWLKRYWISCTLLASDALSEAQRIKAISSLKKLLDVPWEALRARVRREINDDT